MKNNWYFIDNFDLRDDNLKYRVLKSFKSKNSRIVLQHYFFNHDDFSEDEQKEIIEEDFEYFCEMGYSSYTIDKNTTDKIISIAQDSNMVLEQKSIIEIINNNLGLEENKLMQIKRLISKVINNKDYLENNDFINRLKNFENYEYVGYRGRLSNNAKYTWYCPETEDEFMRGLKIEGFLIGIVTNDHVNFNNYEYAFEFFEQNNGVLAINDRFDKFEFEVKQRLLVELNDTSNILTEEEFLKKHCSE